MVVNAHESFGDRRQRQHRHPTGAPPGGRGTTLRENLAEALSLCLDLDSTIGKTFSLLDGDTPIESALRSL